MTIEWGEVPNADYYLISMNGVSQTVTGTSATFSGLTEKAEYVVTGISKTNNTGAYIDSSASTLNVTTLHDYSQDYFTVVVLEDDASISFSSSADEYY